MQNKEHFIIDIIKAPGTWMLAALIVVPFYFINNNINNNKSFSDKLEGVPYGEAVFGRSYVMQMRYAAGDWREYLHDENFPMHRLPITLKEVLVYYKHYYIVTCQASIFGLFIMIALMQATYKKACHTRWKNDLGFLFIPEGIFASLFLLSAFITGSQLIKVIYSPRMFLVDYLKDIAML